MSPRIAICYFSRHRQTEKIAEFLAERLRESGGMPALHDLRLDPGLRIDPDRQEAVLLGAPVYALRYPRPVRSFVQRNRGALLRVPKTGFFSVCLAAAGGTPESRHEALEPLREFLDATAWTPQWMASFAGALNYREYNPLIREMMKRITAQRGGPVDTSRDYELTRWEEVERFAKDFGEAPAESPFSARTLPLATRRLNELMPEYDQRLVESVVVDADPERTRRALDELRAEDMPLAELLARIRTFGGAVRAPGFRESASRFGVVPIEGDPERDVIGGLIGRFWQRDFGIRRLAGAGEFRRFDEPGYARVLTGFRFEPLSGSRTRLRAETRIRSTDAEARRKFAVYWLLLGPGIRLYMRSLLRGVARTAPRIQAPERREAA